MHTLFINCKGLSFISSFTYCKIVQQLDQIWKSHQQTAKQRGSVMNQSNDEMMISMMLSMIEVYILISQGRNCIDDKTGSNIEFLTDDIPMFESLKAFEEHTHYVANKVFHLCLMLLADL